MTFHWRQLSYLCKQKNSFTLNSPGYRYGNTIVPMSEADQDNMKYKSEKCLKVLGFTRADFVSCNCNLDFVNYKRNSHYS